MATTFDERVMLEHIRFAGAHERRRMITEFGPGRFIQKQGRKFQSDQTGSLWSSLFPDDEPLVMVEVVNSTPAPDGSREHFFLRVPPHMRTARQAVAWGFGLSEEHYAPIQET